MIERLTSSTSAVLVHLGGKASGLIRLMRAGLEVPEAWVIPASVSVDEARRRECLDKALGRWWSEVTAEFPQSRWAVRSSAVAEDLEGASFAGVYETVLGVDSAAALLSAVETCWKSVLHSRASSYLNSQHMDARAGIAVVLQRMVEADIAGVMLTENPLRPFDGEVVIEATWGLGEALVSGRAEPDHIVLDRLSGAVRQARIGAKEVEIVWATGLVERDVPEARQVMRCLSEHQLAALHRLAVHVETAIGPRRDLEWAMEGDRLYVLQDRPITGLPARRPRQVWTRRFGDEYLAEYTSPLGYDLMVPWIVDQQIDEVARLQGRREILAVEKFCRHDGYVYLCGDYALELARCLPASLRRESQLGAWFDEVFFARLMAVPFQPRTMLHTLIAPLKDRGRGGVRQNLKALQGHITALDEHLVPKLRQDYGALNDSQWRTQFDEADEFGRNHFRVIRWGMAHHGPLLQGLLGKLLESWLSEDSAMLLQTLISGLPGTRTAAINRDVWELGLLAREDPGLRAGLREGVPYPRIREATAASEVFWERFDALLTEHGHRSATREISAERWHEQPDAVLALVRAQVGSDLPGPSPAESEAAAQTRRLDAQRRIRAALGAGPMGALRRVIFDRMLGLLHEYTIYRENQRYHLDYILDHLRQLLLEQGGRLTERGFLNERSEVFYLTGDTFRRLVESPDDVDRKAVTAELVAARAHRERHASKLPAAYLFDGVPTEGKTSSPQISADGGMQGFGASAGRAEGIVRPVARLTDLATVQRGDILVASNIDPGWTSVFPLIAGLVTETGGILSHGAILAREYGIPTVTSLDRALELLPAGARVQVDGSAGTVSLTAAPDPRC